MTDYNQAYAFIAAIAGDPAVAVIDFRAIHDTRKDIPAIPIRDTLPNAWSSLVHYNAQGYGIFAVIAAMDGAGRELANVLYLRAHYVDLDNLSAQQNYERAAASVPAPSFAVQSSPTKFHVYWPIAPYVGNDRFQILQRKLRQVYDGDKTIIDATRVMRLPGTLHQKDPTAPHLVSCHSLAGYGQPLTVEALETAYAAVNIIDAGSHARHDLGEPSLAAPSLEWLTTALTLSDPNDLDRGEWIAITSAVKQAGWSLADPDKLYALWSEWCARYGGTHPDGTTYTNDVGENFKQWQSIRSTELGWNSLVNRIPSLKGMLYLDGKDKSAMVPGAAPAAPPMPGSDPAPPPAIPMPAPRPLDCSGPYLTHLEQQQYFKNCVYVNNMGLMLTPLGRFLNTTQFNAQYGGKHFIIDDEGKKTNEAWAAATRSTLWNVPKVDHVRFVPTQPYGEHITDELGRTGINTYRPANITSHAGDVGPFLRHIAALLPNLGDQKILLDYLAHNVKYPGHKIPWAPLIQSTEGAGKGIIKAVMKHAMGKPYVYYPKASELAQSGAKFNAWLRHRLFVLVDEIRVDERRELIEVLKPLISEEDTEVQSKGVDQDLEDNFSNWCFFSNWKDAIPVDKNGRRFAIMYSPLQTYEDLLAIGMDETYFNAMYAWLKAGGVQIVTHYLLNYDIMQGAIPMRAPETSSSAEAIKLSRGPVERMITDAVEDGDSGFRNGWVSAIMVIKRAKETGIVSRSPTVQTVTTILEKMGYVSCGRAARAYFQEDKDTRSMLFHLGAPADIATYGAAQGYE